VVRFCGTLVRCGGHTDSWGKNMETYWAVMYQRSGEKYFWSPAGYGYLTNGVHLFPTKEAAQDRAKSLGAWFRKAAPVKVFLTIAPERS